LFVVFSFQSSVFSEGSNAFPADWMAQNENGFNQRWDMDKNQKAHSTKVADVE